MKMFLSVFFGIIAAVVVLFVAYTSITNYLIAGAEEDARIAKATARENAHIAKVAARENARIAKLAFDRDTQSKCIKHWIWGFEKESDRLIIWVGITNLCDKDLMNGDGLLEVFGNDGEEIGSSRGLIIDESRGGLKSGDTCYYDFYFSNIDSAQIANWTFKMSDFYGN